MIDRAAERAEFLSRVRPGATVPVARAFVCDSLTPVALLSRMRRSGAECFLLESVAGGESVARYTFLGCAPVGRLAIEGSTVVQERAGRRLPAGSDPLQALERLVTAKNFVPDPELPPLSAGAVGYLGYDAVRAFEKIPDRHPRDGAMPDGVFMLFDSVVAFDHPRQRLLPLTKLAFYPPRQQERQVEAAIVRLDRHEAFLTASGQEMDAPRAASVDPGRGPRESFAPIMPREKFLEAVERAREAILAGDAYQIVLSQRWTSLLEVDPFDVYRALRMLNPSPYLFYLETREGTILGVAEMLVRCRGGVAERARSRAGAPQPQSRGRQALARAARRSEGTSGTSDAGRSRPQRPRPRLRDRERRGLPVCGHREVLARPAHRLGGQGKARSRTHPRRRPRRLLSGGNPDGRPEDSSDGADR